MMMMWRIKTERLTLRALSEEDLMQLIRSSNDYLVSQVAVEDVRLSPDALSESILVAMGRKLVKMKDMTVAEHPWYTYWLIIENDAKEGIGFIGFKGSPDNNGLVEVGYGMGMSHRRSGYMKESLDGIAKWAFCHDGCHGIKATNVLEENIPSQKVLEGVGFTIVSYDLLHLNYLLKKESYQPR